MRRFLITILALGTLLAGAAPMAPRAAAQDTDAPGSLASMLQLVPLTLGGDAGSAMLTYSNPALQLQTVGVTAPEAGDEEGSRAWVNALGRIPVHSNASRMILPEWEEGFGFSLFDVDQAVEFSAPPASFTVLRGRFANDLVSRWEAEGYEARETEHGTHYTVREDFAIDFESDLSRLAMATANHLAILDADTIVLSSVEQLVIAAVDLAAGEGNSYASELNVASLLSGVPDNLAAATIVQGSALLDPGLPVEILLTPEAPDLDALATETAARAETAAAMPPLTMALLGMTAGGPMLTPDGATPLADLPPAQAVAVVVTVSESAATTAAEVIDTRLAETSPRDWSEFFAGWRATVVDGEPVVTLELELAEGRPPGILIDMLYRRELGFLAWGP